MASVGTAFVDVRADLSKFNADVDQGATSLMAKIGGAIKDNLGKIAVVGAFVGLEQIGERFDEAFDKIRIQTGATGDALKGLQGDFKATLSGVPSSMGDVSTAIGGISQKLGLTGAPLQKLSTQILTLSRITKTDLNANIAAVTGTFNQWGVSAQDQGTKLDELFRVSQKTGISVTQLGETMSTGGVRFREAGLSFEQSASLLGLLAKNGLDANAVMPALSRALATAAKDGKPAQQVFQDTFAAIRNAPNDTEAAGVALKVFGARAGPQFAALIREGKLSYEDFSKAIADGGDTIMQAASQTDDWREKLETLKNKALVALEPIASRVFEGLTSLIGFAADAIDRFSKSPAWVLIRDSILPGIGHAFQDFLFGFQNPDTKINATGWEGAVFRVAEAFGKAFEAIKTVVGATITFIVNDILPQITAGVGAVVDFVIANWPQVQAAFQATVDWLQNADWSGLFDRIKQGYQASADWITSVGVPDLGAAWQWLQTQAQALAVYVSERWSDIQKAIDNVTTYLKVLFVEFFGPVILLWQTSHDQILAIVNVAWNQMKAIVELAINSIKAIIDIVLGILSLDWSRAWDGIRQLLGGNWDFMVATVGNGIEAIKQIISGGLAFVEGIFTVAWGLIRGVLGGAWDAIVSAVQGGIDRVVGLVGGLPGRVTSALAGFFGAVFGPLTGPFLAAAGVIIGALQNVLDKIDAVKNALTLGSLGSGSIAADIASGKKSAGGRLATSPMVSLIGEAGNEAVINGDQAVRVLWAIANGQGAETAGNSNGGGQTVNINVQAEAKVADADELYSVFRRGELLVGARR
jgi:TP901 family phage tail tape measure protein